MHSNHYPLTVCYALGAGAELRDRELVGMFAHELGHLVGERLRLPAHMRYSGTDRWTPKPVQQEADQVARLMGFELKYNQRTLQEVI